MDLIEQLNGDKPTLEVVREWVLKNPDPDYGHLYAMYNICKINQRGSKYDAMDKLQMCIICYNLAEEMLLLDRMMRGDGRSTSLSWFYDAIIPQIGKIYNRMSNAGKYSEYDHFMKIEYTAKKKEKS